MSTPSRSISIIARRFRSAGPAASAVMPATSVAIRAAAATLAALRLARRGTSPGRAVCGLPTSTGIAITSRSIEDFDVASQCQFTLSFDGGGPRVGLQGRRYFGKQHWCSLFLKGDISVLLGQMEQTVVRTDQNDFRATLSRTRPADHSGHRTRSGCIGPVDAAAHSCRPATCSAPGTILGFRDQFNFQTQRRSQLRRRQHPRLRRLLLAAGSRLLSANRLATNQSA